MKELKVVALMGTILTKDELEEFMAEADSVSIIVRKMMYNQLSILICHSTYF